MKKIKKNKISFIIFMLGCLILLAAIFILIFYKKVETKEWSTIYKDYLLSIYNGEEKYAYYPSTDNKNVKIGFYNINRLDAPVMIISSEAEDGTSYKYFYAIGENGKVSNLSFGGDEELKLLYNIKNDYYGYYMCSSVICYEPYNIIFGEKVDYSNSKEYVVFDSGNPDTKPHDLDGTELTQPKFEEVFIDLNIENIQTNFDITASTDEYINNFNKAVKKYKDFDQLVTKDVKKKIEKTKK